MSETLREDTPLSCRSNEIIRSSKSADIMKKKMIVALSILIASVLLMAGSCNATESKKMGAGKLDVVAVETFLADAAQHVAGDRLKITALMPLGADPHSFEPTPGDVKKVADCDVLIVNGGGFEVFLDKLLLNAGGACRVIDASAGLSNHGFREEQHQHEEGEYHHEGDPHFWLDVNHMIAYVQNIQRGLSEADPDGARIYAANADVYIDRLRDLDRWIADQVALIPPDRRLLVTNHESLGYFAGRYGFRIVGSIVPSASSEASPSAKELARLADRIKATGARAVFLETGTNPQLARQLAAETGIRVATGLYTHSISDPAGPAPSYVDMMKYNTATIVNALK
jgi:ABC-type Zn uptake system ZnuABC Zn-binding protein ZnuA